MDKNIKLNAGVSIIEIMIAMVIVAIALIAIASVFPRMTRHGKAMHESDQARVIASQVLEAVQMFSTLDFPAGCDTACLSITNAGFVPTGYTAFRTRWSTGGDTIASVRYNARWGFEPLTGANAGTAIARCTVSWNKNNRLHRIIVNGLVLN